MIVAKFERSGAELDINDQVNYSIGTDFVPPTAVPAPTLGRGTDAWDAPELLDEDPASLRAFGFAVHVFGDSEAEVRQSIAWLNYFIRSGNPRERVHLVVSGNDDADMEPCWGEYGAYLRYPVASGSAIAANYAIGGIRNGALPDCRVELMIGPAAEGKEMEVGSAIGGVIEDVYGSTDRRSKGLIIPEATTNKMTNPVFGHATYNNAWTAGASIVSSLNTDPKYILFGKRSVKITSNGATNGYYQSINVGNTNAHTLTAWIKLPDGGVPSTSVCQLYYNTGLLTTTYTSIGNGFYRLSAALTGVASAVNVAIVTLSGYSIYLCGMQLEEKAYGTPLCWGDLMGCAWTGTAHASTSTRTAARWRISGSKFSVAQGTALIVWTPDRASTAAGAGLRILDTTGSTMRFIWNNSNNTWNLYDGTNNPVSSATSYAANTPIVIHIVWGPGTLKAYINGAISCNGSTYTPAAAPAYVYLGTTNAAATHSDGTYGGFILYDRAMTATEISTQYANIYQWISDGRRLSAIPWFYNTDGDLILDNCDDSTRDNWGAAGGIPGTFPAGTRWEITPSNHTRAAYWLAQSITSYGDWIIPSSQWYEEYSGVVDTGNASGDQYSSVALSASGYPAYCLGEKDWLFTDKLHFFIRMGITTGSVSATMKPGLALGSGDITYGEAKSVTLDTTYRLYYVGSLTLQLPAFLLDSQVDVYPYVTIYAASGTGKIDYIMVTKSPVVRIFCGTDTSWTSIILKGRNAVGMFSGLSLYQLPARGQAINLIPGKLSTIHTISGDDGDAHTLTDTMTLQPYVTPRYALL